MVLMLFGWLFFQLVPSKMSKISNVDCMLLYTKCVSKQMSTWIGVKHLAVKEPHDDLKYSNTYIKKWRPPHILKQGCCNSRKSPYTREVPTVRPRRLMVLEDCLTFLLGISGDGPFSGGYICSRAVYTFVSQLDFSCFSARQIGCLLQMPGRLRDLGMFLIKGGGGSWF